MEVLWYGEVSGEENGRTMRKDRKTTKSGAKG
jgi:hypothetical protein